MYYNFKELLKWHLLCQCLEATIPRSQEKMLKVGEMSAHEPR